MRAVKDFNIAENFHPRLPRRLHDRMGVIAAQGNARRNNKSSEFTDVFFIQRGEFRPRLFRSLMRFGAVVPCGHACPRSRKHANARKARSTQPEHSDRFTPKGFYVVFYVDHEILILALTQFQRGQPHQSQNNGDDPEPDNDGRLGPALLFKMVVQRRHRKNPLPG